MGDRSGEQFGNHRLIRLLGQGGFANVYLGEHVLMGTQAAVKVLDDPGVTMADKDDFLQEARFISRLNSPNIVRFFEFGKRASDDILYLVMEYMPRGNIRQLHPEGSIISFPIVISYIKQLASALQAVHDAKIVHRDIKPENILIGTHGELLLTDFGSAVPAHNPNTMKFQHILGTWPYVAPEQFLRKAETRSDIYSLGIFTYELLCGDVPFFVPSGTGSKTGVMYYQKHKLEIPPPINRPGVIVPAPVEQVVMKALAKNPDDRYQTVMEYATALEQAAIPPTPTPPNPPIQPQRRPFYKRPASLSIGVTLLILIFIGASIIRSIASLQENSALHVQAVSQTATPTKTNVFPISTPIVKASPTPTPTDTPLPTQTPTPTPTNSLKLYVEVPLSDGRIEAFRSEPHAHLIQSRWWVDMNGDWSDWITSSYPPSEAGVIGLDGYIQQGITYHIVLLDDGTCWQIHKLSTSSYDNWTSFYPC